MKELIGIAYIPVLHKGYMEFVSSLRERGAAALFLVDSELVKDVPDLEYISRKDVLRALPLHEIKKALSAVTDMSVEILTREDLVHIAEGGYRVVLPQEDVSVHIARTYLENVEVAFDPIFLRWNKENVGEDVEPDVDEVTLSEFEQSVLTDVLMEAGESFDWWRQVGAALIQDGEVIAVTHNEHMPGPQIPNVLGDTRALFKKGININYVTSAHAEVVAIATAAKRGVKTEGATLLVTDFPCPYCARLIAKSGIKKVYFIKGYAVLGGDAFLREEGVEVYKVRVEG